MRISDWSSDVCSSDLLISPIEEDETPGDEDRTRGNPELRNEKAWGVDVGYERSLGSRGIFGVNFFYRDITDLIEHVKIGRASCRERVCQSVSISVVAVSFKKKIITSSNETLLP